MDFSEVMQGGKAADFIINGIDRHKFKDVAFLRNSYVEGKIEEDDLKIFILDKVNAQIEIYSQLDSEKDKSGIIIGNYIENNNEKILVINGVIEARHTSHIDGVLEYTEETWEAIYNEKEKIYSGKEIIGWFYVCPGYGGFLTTDDEFLKNNFSDFKWKVAFVIDPSLGNKSIFQRKENDIEKTTGFFVYSKTKSLSQKPFDTKEENKSKVEKEFTHKEIESLLEKNDEEKNKVGKNMNIRLKTTPNTFTNILSLLLLVTVIIMIFNLVGLNRKYKELSKEEVAVNASQEMNIKVKELETRIKLLEKELDEKLEGLETSEVNNGEEQTQTADTATPKFTEYVVQSGDTIWSISEKFYGTGSKSNLIIDANGGTEKIVVGETLLIPNI